jgi:hypothetical protein
MRLVGRGRRLLLLLGLYVLLDFSNPFMPGAFEFELSNSVDGLSQPRQRAVSAPAVTLPSAPVARLEPRPAALRPSEPAVVLGRLLTPVRPLIPYRSDTASPAPPGDDPH